jgi:hypothetical protein
MRVDSLEEPLARSSQVVSCWPERQYFHKIASKEIPDSGHDHLHVFHFTIAV